MTAWAYLRMVARQNRRGFLGWLVAIVGMSALYASSYKSISGVKSAAIRNYPAALKRALNLQDFTSPAGYLASTVFGIPLLLLLTIFVINNALRAVAGDEESGALDLVLSYPVTRRMIVFTKAAATGAAVALMGLSVFVVVLLVRGAAGLHIGAGKVGATCLTWVLLGWCLGGIALLVSAATGRRSVTLGLSVLISLLAYLADSFLPLIDGLGWVRQASPYYWFVGPQPLADGASWSRCGLLLAVAVVATAAAAVAFERRDLRV